MKKSVFTLCAASLMTSFIATAGPTKDYNYVWVDTWDTDSNQQVTIEEFFAARKARFNETDENGDGLVDLDEYRNEYENRLDAKITSERAQSVKQTKMRFNAMDKNDDNIMSKEEYMAVAKRGFDYYDSDKNGMITDEDKAPKYRSRKAKKELSEQEIAHNKLKRKIASAKRVVHMPSTHNKKGMLSLYDANDNGAIAWQEYAAVREEMFSRTDENGDNQLNFDEYLAEFENRLDTQINKIRTRMVERTDKRFDVLDVDNNDQMTFEEFQLSGVRTFLRYDLDKDGSVTFYEEAPEKSLETAVKMAAKKSKENKY